MPSSLDRRALTFFALAAPNILLGGYLAKTGFGAMVRQDGTGEATLAGFVGLIGVGLALSALPALHWASSAGQRESRAHRLRVVAAALLLIGTSGPVSAGWYLFTH